jgi:hypothetical protein
MSIYDAIGGEATVGAVVDELYRRLLDDSAPKRYFDGVDMVQLARHQRAFITAALGGPARTPAGPRALRTPDSASPTTPSIGLRSTWLPSCGSVEWTRPRSGRSGRPRPAAPGHRHGVAAACGRGAGTHQL